MPTPSRTRVWTALATERALVVGLWCVALGLGATHAWYARHAIDPDGISYMDLADAWLRGDWANVVNGYWSPLYAWFLAAGLAVFRPTPYWEATVAHGVNFVIYACALACFHFLWAGLVRHVHTRRAACDSQELALPRWLWWALGYGLFVWSSLDLITLALVTPDVCVATMTYLLAGVLVRMSAGDTRWRTFGLLGVLLGLGYYAKAIMVPMGAVFLIVAVLSGRPMRRSIAGGVVALLIAVVMASPYVAALSKAKGRFTWSDTHRLNYAWHVNGIYPWDHWRGQPPGLGTPKHPTRQLLEQPAVYEFATPVAGCYPVWYDPTYWLDGVQNVFRPRQQLGVIAGHIDEYFDLFFLQQGAMIFPLLVLFALRGRWRASLRDLAAGWWLFVPALAGLGIYALVHVEFRYVAPFVVLLWAGALAAVRIGVSAEHRRVARAVCGVCLLGLATQIGYQAYPALARTALDARWRMDTAGHRQWRIANELHRMGIEPGDKLAHVGQALKSWSYWARLARVRIITELRPDDAFWLADDATRARVMELFRQAGAKAVIARRRPMQDRPFGLPVDFAPGWRAVANTDHYVFFLDPPDTTRAGFAADVTAP